ncbi:MAG: YtxH domain-containing protein [Flavobacteriaceae bacterium]|nr:YtxH domain-containing protein [Flavobacteriaceae bacterium]
MSNNNTGNILLALLSGAAIGAGIGILYAPDEGKKTRKKIKTKVIDGTHDLTDRLVHAKEELTKTVDEKKEDFEHKLEDAISTMSYKADDIIASLERKLEELKVKNAKLQK